MFYLKLYDKNHSLKDNCDIHLFSNLQYTKTLNGVNSLNFNVPVNYLKQNEIEINLNDDIELYMTEFNTETCIWWGKVINPTNTSVNEISVVCEGYFSCLFNKIQKHLYDHFINTGNKDYLEETYSNVGYGELILSLIGTQNYYDFTGVSQGANKDYSKLKTTRIISWDDLLDEKISEFIEAGGLYFEIDQDKKFNIYSSYGEDKSEYYIIQDGNLLSCSQNIIDYSKIINQVYALNNFTEEQEDGTQVDKYVTYIAEDKESIALYGLKQEVLTVNDLREQDTIKSYAEQELSKVSRPTVNIILNCTITDELNIYSINTGDYISIDSKLLGLKGKYKVLEYTVDLTTQTVEISLGNCLYRNNEIKQYRY